MSNILVVGGSGFIGSYLLREVEADNIDLKEGTDIRSGIGKSYDTIIFLACNQENTREAYEYNRQMYEVLSQYYKDNSIAPYLIYISSAAVYTPNNWYSLSKFLGESYAQRFNGVILRLSNVFGHGDGHGVPDRFMRGENRIHGDGFQIRDLIPVELVVTAILNCLETKFRGTFNVSSGRGTDVNDMFKVFGKGEPTYDDKSVGVKKSILTPGEVHES